MVFDCFYLVFSVSMVSNNVHNVAVCVGCWLSNPIRLKSKKRLRNVSDKNNTININEEILKKKERKKKVCCFWLQNDWRDWLWDRFFHIQKP